MLFFVEFFIVETGQVSSRRIKIKNTSFELLYYFLNKTYR